MPPRASSKTLAPGSATEIPPREGENWPCGTLLGSNSASGWVVNIT